MGVKTPLKIEDAKVLFQDFEIEELETTRNGLVDTTYLTSKYVIKKYEKEHTQQEDLLLELMRQKGLNVPVLLASKNEWYLYTRLQGKHIQTVKLHHIVLIARFLKKLHGVKISCPKPFYDSKVVKRDLRYVKQHFFYYYKRFESLLAYQPKQEKFIHGDLFLDNAVFGENGIGVFDFADSGCGEVAFDVGVALMACKMDQKQAAKRLFLQVYNQKNFKKLNMDVLDEAIKYARLYYALRRVAYFQRVKEAKSLL